MKLQHLTIDFAPLARPMDARLARLEPYWSPVAAAAAALALLIYSMSGA
jgi:hypothetical protein